MKLDILKDHVQSANINFLIGSGLSCPFLPVLGSIERQLADVNNLPEDKRENVTVSLYREYFERVIAPNLLRRGKEEDYSKTLANYSTFLKTWNEILHKRCISLRSKQVNIFSTNIDLMVENAVEAVGVEFNDGFIGSVKPVFNEANFQKSIRKESIHFQNSTELPLFNLLKMHGSVNWKECEGKIINDYNLSLVENVCKIIEKYDEGVFPVYFDDNVKIAEQVKDCQDLSEFVNAYRQFQIVNPTKRKFSETVLDVHFYELMRMFSNNLEKENTVLFVMGFSFADEHIRSIVQRAMKTNPTLFVIVFSFTDIEGDSFELKLGNNNGNLVIVTPSSFNKDNNIVGDEIIKQFDFESINNVFKKLLDLIPVKFGDGK